MTIEAFAAALATLVKRQRPSAALENEFEFEFHHVAKPAWRLASRHPDIHLCVHPSPPREKCAGGCHTAAGRPALRRRGCPTCWHDSKDWSVVKAYGLKHNFDLVARDSRSRTLAVEVKWLSFEDDRPNAEFQRFVGQCALAAARHTTVLGICGIKGRPDISLIEHERLVEERLRQIGVQLVVVAGRRR